MGYPQSSTNEPDHRISFCFGPLEPFSYAAIPETERRSRARLNSDLCIIDNTNFFIRGCLDIPIVNTKGVFRWLVWASVSGKSFDLMLEHWEKAGRETDPPYFGWLNTRLPHYPDTLNLKVNVHTRPVGERPQVEVEPTNHPLAIEQRSGISRSRAQGLANLTLSEWS